jgi:hypothetical protein
MHRFGKLRITQHPLINIVILNPQVTAHQQTRLLIVRRVMQHPDETTQLRLVRDVVTYVLPSLRKSPFSLQINIIYCTTVEIGG